MSWKWNCCKALLAGKCGVTLRLFNYPAVVGTASGCTAHD